MTIAFLNGEFMPLSEAKISPMDRGFLFGDGIYEVIPTYHGKAVGMTGHLSRMRDGLAAISITNPYSAQQWQQNLDGLIDANASHFPSGNIGVYFHISRGTDTKRYHAYPQNITPTVFGFAFEIAPAQPLEADKVKPFKVALEEDKRWQRCHIKSTSLLGNVMHFQAGVESGVQETILHNSDGIITEASSCNVFMVKDNAIFTPPLDNQLLPGITRQIALEAFKQAGLVVEEKWFTTEDLFNADEVWLTSSSKEIAPVIEVDGKTIGIGEVGQMWEKAIKAYHNYKFEA
ncbi:D-alanine aminotransferase [Alteromonas stellipolaris]|uniref:D-amino acid aminotransferase n=1 Tax=Alteromonas stellipolaris TaxID=233316 RepID=UPI0007702691|nr:D-amino acid aminotransferase [Alteromonas stellipolaris]AMJ93931.1 D-alanine aminotransferase [Alteromonas stellipolaris]MDO6535306.1 D-amino acid aminotransferase [Alteromonas stellipolaris]MDO6627182.1 D-amino acid aminotransferase [Alteromonas stellipolaris]MDP2535633.1 D-amino acid aminotransferase [Alteromonas stellipolaris]MDP2596083.1 D-amino acid aminotransferase [Alteromonas stellipolaris]